jgi:hypothetical protein
MVNARTMFVMLLMLAPASWSQTAPKAVAGATDVAQAPADSSQQYARPQEDFRPASGAQPLSLGLGGKKQMDITLFTTQSWDSAALGSTTPNGDWERTNSFGGSLSLALDRQSSQTTLNYNGHAINYSERDPAWSSYQTLGFSHALKIGRWGLTALDSFSLSPDSPFGGYGFGLPSGETNGQAVVSPQYQPNQSILTPYATNYNNTVSGQVSYGFSRRTNVTASVAYGTLRFIGDNVQFQNTNQITASSGYNYNLTAKDTISATYSFGRIAYTDFDSNFVTHTMQLGYSHKLNGRFSFQLAGGPEILDTSNLGFADTRVQASGSASLLYSRSRNNLSVSYFKGTTGGSGVLTGAQTQSAQFSVGREFSKALSASLSVGYANNSGLVQQQTYDSLFVSPSLHRSITRNFGFTLNYSYQHQISGATCVGLACGNLDRSLASVGLEYRFRPIRLE